MEILSLFIMFIIAIFASAFGTLIGGSSIVTIPALILFGLPPHTAIGTDRFGIIGVGISGWYKFHKKGLINYKIGLIVAVPVLFGTALGANLVLQISESVLKHVIVVTNILQTLNFSLNFLLYCMVNTRFRDTLKEIIRFMLCIKKKSYHAKYSTRTRGDGMSISTQTTSSKTVMLMPTAE